MYTKTKKEEKAKQKKNYPTYRVTTEVLTTENGCPKFLNMHSGLPDRQSSKHMKVFFQNYLCRKTIGMLIDIRMTESLQQLKGN